MLNQIRDQTRVAQPPPVIPSPPRQQSPTEVEDNRYGFSNSQPTQPMTVPIPVPLSTPSPPLSPSPVPSSMSTPPRETLPQSDVLMDDHDASDSGSDDNVSAPQPEIDEQSDDEDERQAHALLRAAPRSSVVAPVQQTSTAVQLGNHSFAVRMPTLLQWATKLTIRGNTLCVGAWCGSTRASKSL
jgi:hypothetical protein